MKRLYLMIGFFIMMTSSVVSAQQTVGFLVGAGGLGDESYNDMTIAGLAEAKRQFGVRVIHEQSDETVPGIKAAIDRMIAQNAHIIVANRIAFPEVLEQYARKFKTIYFILNDMPWKGNPNTVSIGYSHHQGAFLAGALAGWMTKSGKVGLIGGNEMPIIESFRVGYRAGLEYANPKAVLLDESVRPGYDAKGFNDPKHAYEMALVMYHKRVDIIFGVAGLSGNGVIQAAKQAGKFAIGVDTDQDHMAKGHVLTSMMKRLDKATFQEVSAIIKNHFKPGVKYYGLAQGGIELSPMRYTRQLIGDDILNKLSNTRQNIISGKIKLKGIDYLK